MVRAWNALIKIIEGDDRHYGTEHLGRAISTLLSRQQYISNCPAGPVFLQPFPPQRPSQTGKGRLRDTETGIALFSGDFSDSS